MLNIFKKIKLNKAELQFHYFFKDKRTNKKELKSKVLVENVENLYYYSLFGLIAQSNPSYIFYQYHQSIINRINIKDNFYKKAKIAILAWLHQIRWSKLYSSFAIPSYLNLIPSINLFEYFNLFIQSYSYWRSIDNLSKLVNLKYRDILIGDLIIDTYLCFGEKLFVNTKDIYLLYIIYRALYSVKRCYKIFDRIKPDIYLTSFCSYLQHGIPVRVALIKCSNVYSCGNFQDICKKLNPNDFLETKNTSNYLNDFQLIENKFKKLISANKAIKSRVKGVVDNSIVFMKQSAYSKQNINWKSEEKSFAVIFLHDFYDAPHIYGDLVFNDFFSWATFTIESLIRKKLLFYVKAHPNRNKKLDNGINKLIEIYNTKIKMLPEDVSILELVNSGLRVGFSIYGTIIGELAYFGIPTITCSNHASYKFSFSINAKSIDEYSDLIDKLKLEECFTNSRLYKYQSLIFYYMHNLNYSYSYLTCRSKLFTLYKLLNIEQNLNPTSIFEILNDLSDSGDKSILNFQNL